VVVSLDSWSQVKVASSRHEFEVSPAPPNIKLEPVSSRLKSSLAFPVREIGSWTILFSPDGQRIAAGSYDDGNVQVWDAHTGKQLCKFETGETHRAIAFFSISPDWTRLYSARQTKRKATRIEKEGMKLVRWECEGEVRAWDLATGELKATYRHSPPRGIFHSRLSPDGRWLVTVEECSVESATGGKRTCTLWDTATSRARELPPDLFAFDVFSPDGRTLAAAQNDGDYVVAIKLLDTETLEEKVSIPVAERYASAGPCTFSPDGRTIVTYVQVWPGRNDYDTSRSYLKFSDASTGAELATLPAEQEKAAFIYPTFSPDGRLLAAPNWRGEPRKLYFFDMQAMKLRGEVVLDDKASAGRPAFSPDGKWLAIVTQAFPTLEGGRDPLPEEVPQARIHIIDVDRGAIAETLIAPPGFVNCATFSPDGKTLATGGWGKVLLWDFSTPPGTKEKVSAGK
jgi:WD40 repeat protein